MSRLPGPNASADAIRHQLTQPLGGDDSVYASACVQALEAEILRLRERVTVLQGHARVALAHVRDDMPAAAAEALQRIVAEAETSV